ncbi:MAG: LamG domain-containing protein [Proteobacteria bacterium]|nr:LamG domain-containing protein [Pseudomonadota bacterium]
MLTRSLSCLLLSVILLPACAGGDVPTVGAVPADDDLCLPSYDAARCDAHAALPAPVLHWSYDERVPGGVLDTGADGTDGWFTGSPTFGAGLLGDAMLLDGSSWLLADDAVALDGARFTLATWVRSVEGDNPGPHHFLMSNGNGSPAFTGASLLVDDDGAARGLIEGGSAVRERLPTGPAICSDGWAHVAVTFDHGDIEVFVDGVSAGVTAVEYDEVVWGLRRFGVGNDPNNLSRAFIGEVDETMVFDAALSSSALLDLRTAALCAR